MTEISRDWLEGWIDALDDADPAKAQLRTLLDYADERDEAVALLREARLIVGTNVMESSSRTPGRAAKARDLTPRIDALLRRVGGNHD